MWIFSSLIVINMWAGPERLVRDFSLFRRTGGALHSSSTSESAVDGVCLLTEDKQGQVGDKATIALALALAP